MHRLIYLLLTTTVLGGCNEQLRSVQAVSPSEAPSQLKWSPKSTTDGSEPSARHEAAFVRVGDKAYLLGGRGIKPVDVLDLATMTWSEGKASPVEIHHFQPVVHNNEIYLMGAMTGGYPVETPLPNVHIYNPATDEWRIGATIPKDRRRGGAGAVLHEGKIYLVCGIVDGHRGGHVPWLDSYDPTTDAWTELDDAPRPRDHFQAVSHGGKIYAAAGRTTVAATNPFANTIGVVDVYDVDRASWSTLTDTIPTHRAGNAAIISAGRLIVLGGESTAHEVAHDEVEALALPNGGWTSLPRLSRGRHGTGVVAYKNALVMASGCGNRGGAPELSDIITTK